MDPLKRHQIVCGRLARFVIETGIVRATDLDVVDPDVVEAFVVHGLTGRASSTKGTYRSVLLGGGRAHAEHGTPFPGAPGAVPYAPKERADLIAMARAQRQCANVDAALVLISFGIGAGTSSGELIGAKWSDVMISPHRVTLAINGSRSRTVPVAPPIGPTIRELASRATDSHCFRPGRTDRTYKNFVSDFTDHLVRDPSATRLCLSRCRSSFLCDHLADGTPLGVLCELSGIREVGSLLRFARHITGAPQSKAALRAKLLAELRCT